MTGKPRVSLLLKIATLTSLPILAIMMAALLVVSHRLADEVNRNVTADLQRAALEFENQMEREGENLERIGTVVARDPKFFAVLTLPHADRADDDFQATLLGVARDFQRDAEAPLFDVTDEHGRVLARAGRADSSAADRSRWPLVRQALGGRAARGYFVEGGHAYRIAVVPILVEGSLTGTLTLGRPIDSELADRLRATTRSDVVFVVNGRASIRTSVPGTLADRLARSPTGRGVIRVTDGDHRFLALCGLLEGPTSGGRLAFAVLRSLDQETAVLERIGRELTIGGAVLIVVALVVGFLVSSGVTRPVRRIVDAANAMREGNYDFPLDVRSADEMGTLAAHFEAMREAQRHEIERLEEIDRMKSDFIAIASHEILTPVTTIRAYTDLMIDGISGEHAAELQRDGFQAIRSAAESLTRIARDLTNMSLIDRRRLPLRLEPVDLALIAEEVAVQTIALAERRQQIVTIAIEPGLYHPGVDAVYLKKAVTNLAQNAVRFTRDGGWIEVGAHRAGESIEIYVKDSGIGISKDDFERIFAKIVELKDVNLHSSGTTEFNSSGLGLGLSIARGIVEAHAGTIRVESQLGRGSTFTIVIPASASAEPDGHEARLAS